MGKQKLGEQELTNLAFVLLRECARELSPHRFDWAMKRAADSVGVPVEDVQEAFFPLMNTNRSAPMNQMFWSSRPLDMQEWKDAKKGNSSDREPVDTTRGGVLDRR